MKKSSDVKVENVKPSSDATLEPSAAAEVPTDAAQAERAEKLKAAQEKAAQLMREQRYEKAKHVLKDAENLRAQEAPAEPVAEVDYASKLAAAQDKMTQLMREKHYDEARRVLKEIEALQTEETNVQRLAGGVLQRPIVWIVDRLPDRPLRIGHNRRDHIH